MKRNTLILALLAATLFIFTAAPVMAETMDPFDPDALLEKHLQEESGKGLKLNEAADDYHLAPNADIPGTYTLTVHCDSSDYISFYSISTYKEYRNKITKVVIENGDKEAAEIGAYAFWDCGSLRSVKMPATIKTIGKCAFYNCYCLSEIDLSYVTSIGTSAFNNCGPNAMGFNFRASITESKRILACSPAAYDIVRPDSEDGPETQYWDAYREMKNILADLDLDGKTDIEKVKAIYGWVVENVDYDYDALEVDDSSRRYGYAGTIHSALIAHQAICHGYSVLLRAMMNAAGVDCVYIAGPTVAGDHAWNMIRINDKWYLCDSTWDAGDIWDDFNYTTATYFLRSKTFFYSNEGMHGEPDKTDAYNAFYPLSDTDYYAKIKQGDYSYIIDEDHAILTEYTGSARELTLPSYVTYDGDEVPVTVIGPESLCYLDTVEKLIIPEGYTQISKNAISGWALEYITLPSTMEIIDADAFSNVDLLFNVTYNGTIEQFLAIDIGYGNYSLCHNVIKCTDGNYEDPRDIAKAKITVSPKSFVYDGTSHLPEITINLNGTVLEDNKDYMLRSLYDDTLKPGKKVDIYRIEILGLGDYSRFGTVAEFKILPMPTKLNKLKAGKKTLTVYWTKKTEQVSGYQVQYALNKKFTKGKKTINVKGNQTGSLKIKKLKSRKTYYVRVRTRKPSNGKYTECNMYSSWSNWKKIRVK